MNRRNSGNDTITPERLEALRQKIDSGDYDTSEVAETVARRIIQRGDLRGDRRDQRGGYDSGDRFGPPIH
jgi:hypothetical protein